MTRLAHLYRIFELASPPLLLWTLKVILSRLDSFFKPLEGICERHVRNKASPTTTYLTKKASKSNNIADDKRKVKEQNFKVPNVVSI